LSSSLGGRLFKRIRDELGKAYALSGGFSPGMDMGVCYFFVLTTEDNVNKVVSLIEEELKKAAEGGFSTKEIVDAKEYLKAEFARENQSISDQAGRDIRSEFYGLGHKAYQLYSQRIDAVTGNMAQEICQVYLNPSRAALVITRPKK
jgi:predicted Zn-dependent peptidase